MSITERGLCHARREGEVVPHIVGLTTEVNKRSLGVWRVYKCRLRK